MSVEHPLRCHHFSIFLLCLQDISAIVFEMGGIMRRSHSFTDHAVVILCLGEFGGFNFGRYPEQKEVPGQNSSRWGTTSAR
jgi:hypothetical protein